jgi:hypothetical protein
MPLDAATASPLPIDPSLQRRMTSLLNMMISPSTSDGEYDNACRSFRRMTDRLPRATTIEEVVDSRRAEPADDALEEVRRWKNFAEQIVRDFNKLRGTHRKAQAKLSELRRTERTQAAKLEETTAERNALRETVKQQAAELEAARETARRRSQRTPRWSEQENETLVEMYRRAVSMTGLQDRQAVAAARLRLVDNFNQWLREHRPDHPGRTWGSMRRRINMVLGEEEPRLRYRKTETAAATAGRRAGSRRHVCDRVTNSDAVTGTRARWSRMADEFIEQPGEIARRGVPDRRKR